MALLYTRQQEGLPSLYQETLEHYKSVFGLRRLSVADVQEILDGTPRRLGTYVQITHDFDLPIEDTLEPGQGFFIPCETEFGGHAVSVFRCLDGQYVFYDSLGLEPIEDFGWFVLNNGIPEDTVTVAAVRIQHKGIDTCAYHALTFLEYATSTNIVDHRELISSFVCMMGPNTEHSAVSLVKTLLSEFDTTIDLRFRPGAELHVISRVVPDNLPKEYIEDHRKKLSRLRQSAQEREEATTGRRKRHR